MNRDAAIELLDRLHQAQNAFYGGGSDGELRQLLSPEIRWTVPGHNRIAGTYSGIEEVFAYFRLRRELAAGTFQMVRRDVLVGEGNQVAALTDGVARIHGQEQRWSTVGLYELLDTRIAACWLFPLDPPSFDSIWSGR